MGRIVGQRGHGGGAEWAQCGQREHGFLFEMGELKKWGDGDMVKQIKKR